MESLEIMKAKAVSLQAKISLLQTELDEINTAIAEQEWIMIEWHELEALLRCRPDGGTNYRKNPCVARRRGEKMTYCRIADNGELQVGPWFHNDNFVRGSVLYIHHEKRPWNR